MLATFNLQLSTLDLGAEAPAPQGIAPLDGPSEPAGFAALLDVRVAAAANLETSTGDALPLGGNALPLPDVDITVDGVALEAVSEGDTPVLPVADEQPWESLVTPPGLELREIAPNAPIAVLPQMAAESANSTTPQPAAGVENGLLARRLNPTPGIAATPPTQADTLEAATLKPRLEPLPPVATGSPADDVFDARDQRVLPGLQGVVPRELQPRDVNVTQAQATLQDDGQPLLQDSAARATATPLTQPLATMEEVAEVPRPVVQAGVTQAPTPTPTMQPAALANLAATAAASQADSTFSSTLQQQATDLINTPVRDASWGDRVGERVVMMANNQLKTAEIRLTPAELGPVRIQVNVEDGAANVTFQAQHAITREAIEQALPRLREMFSESGLSLGQTSVGEQNVAGNRDGNARGETRAAGQGDEFLGADDSMPEEQRLTRRHEGLLDTFV